MISQSIYGALHPISPAPFVFELPRAVEILQNSWEGKPTNCSNCQKNKHDISLALKTAYVVSTIFKLLTLAALSTTIAFLAVQMSPFAIKAAAIAFGSAYFISAVAWYITRNEFNKAHFQQQKNN